MHAIQLRSECCVLDTIYIIILIKYMSTDIYMYVCVCVCVCVCGVSFTPEIKAPINLLACHCKFNANT